MNQPIALTHNEQPTKCVKCQKKRGKGMYFYQWEGRDGNACEPCGNEIHTVGFYLLDKAAELLRSHGMKLGAVKEKFGRFEIYANAETEKQRQIVRDLESFYRRQYPELTWEFM